MPGPDLRPATLYPFDPPEGSVPHIRAFRLHERDSSRYRAPHGHQFLEVVYFVEPAGPHKLGTTVWDTAAGDLLLIPPGVAHAWGPHTFAPRSNNEDQEARSPEVWIVEFTAAALNPERPDAGTFPHLVSSPLLFPFVQGSRGEAARLSVPRADRPRWCERLHALAREIETAEWNPPPVAVREAARAHLTLLLVDAARLAARSGRRRGADPQPLLAAVFEAIEGGFRRPISLADIAEAVGRSSAYLTTLVRKRTGRTVLQWILERRLAEARRLLLSTDRSVEAVAGESGFGDPTYFIRQFRRRYGMTPAAWRRAQRGPPAPNPG